MQLEFLRPKCYRRKNQRKKKKHEKELVNFEYSIRTGLHYFPKKSSASFASFKFIKTELWKDRTNFPYAN